MKKEMIKAVGRRFVAISAAAAVIVAGCPGAVYASETEVPLTGSDSRTITGTFTVTEADLTDMGYGPVVSIPTSVTLAYNSGKKAYMKNIEVYAYGLIDDDKTVEIQVDPTNNQFGKIYDSNGDDCSVAGRNGFYCTSDKDSWSADECYGNMIAISENRAAFNIGNINMRVTKNGFTAKKDETYTTNLPIIIRMGGQ